MNEEWGEDFKYYNLRKKKDGFTFFGMKADIETEIVNDFVLPPISASEGDKLEGRHFQIYYDIDSETYYARDLGIGYGLFRNLTQPILLEDSFLMNMGESYIVINLFDEP